MFGEAVLAALLRLSLVGVFLALVVNGATSGDDCRVGSCVIAQRSDWQMTQKWRTSGMCEIDGQRYIIILQGLSIRRRCTNSGRARASRTLCCRKCLVRGALKY